MEGRKKMITLIENPGNPGDEKTLGDLIRETKELDEGIRRTYRREAFLYKLAMALQNIKAGVIAKNHGVVASSITEALGYLTTLFPYHPWARDTILKFSPGFAYSLVTGSPEALEVVNTILENVAKEILSFREYRELLWGELEVCEAERKVKLANLMRFLERRGEVGRAAVSQGPEASELERLKKRVEELERKLKEYLK